MNAHPVRSRLGRAIVVVVAGSVVGVTGALVVSADERPSRPLEYHQEDRAAMAEWAKANNVTGLSPASMSSPRANVAADADLAAAYRAMAEYARNAHLSGLSPASLSPVDD